MKAIDNKKWFYTKPFPNRRYQQKTTLLTKARKTRLKICDSNDHYKFSLIQEKFEKDA